MALFHGEYLSGEFHVEVPRTRDAEVWTVSVTDRWLNRYEEETSAASPYGLLDQLIERAIRGCHAQSARSDHRASCGRRCKRTPFPKRRARRCLGPKRAAKVSPEEEVANG